MNSVVKDLVQPSSSCVMPWQQQMTGGAALTILDVRGPDEFAGALGHIPGAVNIPVGDIANRLIEIKALGDKPVIMVCTSAPPPP